MKIDNVHFSFAEEIPKELEGKTLNEVFDIVKAKTDEIVGRITDKFGNPIYTKEVEEWLKPEETIYLRLAQLFKQMAAGDMSGVQLGVKSPIQIKR